jgi:hypothetical protein
MAVSLKDFYSSNIGQPSDEKIEEISHVAFKVARATLTKLNNQ